jgi:hypothetical protein
MACFQIGEVSVVLPTPEQHKLARPGFSFSTDITGTRKLPKTTRGHDIQYRKEEKQSVDGERRFELFPSVVTDPAFQDFSTEVRKAIG